MMLGRQIHTAEPLVPEPSAFEVELALEKPKSHKSLGIDQVPAELIMARGRTNLHEMQKLIIFIWNKEELPEEWKELTTVPFYKKCDKSVCSNYRGISHLPATLKILSNVLVSSLTPCSEEIIGVINVDCDTTGQLLVIYSAFVEYLRKNGNTLKRCVSSLYT